MKSKSNKRRHIWKILTALILLFCIASAFGTKDTSASKLTSISVVESSVDAARQHMLDIAYLYANHRWQATASKKTARLHKKLGEIKSPSFSFPCYSVIFYASFGIDEHDHGGAAHIS